MPIMRQLEAENFRNGSPKTRFCKFFSQSLVMFPGSRRGFELVTICGFIDTASRVFGDKANEATGGLSGKFWVLDPFR